MSKIVKIETKEQLIEHVNKLAKNDKRSLSEIYYEYFNSNKNIYFTRVLPIGEDVDFDNSGAWSDDSAMREKIVQSLAIKLNKTEEAILNLYSIEVKKGELSIKEIKNASN